MEYPEYYAKQIAQIIFMERLAKVVVARFPEAGDELGAPFEGSPQTLIAKMPPGPESYKVGSAEAFHAVSHQLALLAEEARATS